MIKSKPLFWLFIFVYFSLNSQNCYEKFVQIKNKNSAFTETEIKRLLTKCELSLAQSIEITHYLSIYYYKRRRYDIASKYAKLELDYLKKTGKKNIEYEQTLYNLARFLYKNYNYDEALKYFFEIIDFKITVNKTALSYGEISKCFRQKGELYKAISYAEKGINLLEKTNSYSRLFTLYINTSNTYNTIATERAALKSLSLLNKADSLVNKNKSLQNKNKYFFLNSAFAASYSNLYQFYKLNSDQKLIEYNFEKSKTFYNKNLSLGFKHKDSFNISTTFINLGDFYLMAEKDSAIYFLKRSLDFNKNSSIRKSISYDNIAKYYLRKKHYHKALENINKALNYIFRLKVKKNKSTFSPSELQLLKSDNRKLIFSFLKNKIEILIELSKKTNDTNYLNQAIETVNIADRLVDIIINYSSETNNKLLWREKVSGVYLLGVKASYLLNDNATMFYFMEKNKALLLLQDIKQNVAQTNLPKKIIDQKLKLKKEILLLEDFINTKQENNSFTKEKDSLFFLKKRHETFNDSLKLAYPDYFNKNNDLNILSLETTKNKIDDTTIFISYISNKENFKDTALFGLAISKNKDFAFQIENYEELVKKLSHFKDLIKKPFTTKGQRNQFEKISYNIYNQLFPSDSLKEIIQKKQVIIIPDVIFENIPFEALNTNPNGLEYLIEKTDISYAYSFSFLEQNTNIKRNTKNDFIAFAPINFKNNLAALTATKNEINSIHKKIDGTLYLNEEATKDAFFENSIDAKIIHLATHAKTSNNPEIYFTKDTLKLHDLYTHKINADLVTLSACETNLGEVNQGEGVFSLARGFFYSGANSVVSSLWNVNDVSTTYLMNDFYSNLKDNQTKVEALNNAKRTYLQNHSLSERSPYYWASFILIGNSDTTFEHYYYYYFLGALIFMILFFIFFKKRG